jgi:hypothetical protein
LTDLLDDLESFLPADAPSLLSPVSLPESTAAQEVAGPREHLLKALQHLRKARISLTNLLLCVLGSNTADAPLHMLKSQFLRDDYSNVSKILDVLWEDQKGQADIRAWLIEREIALTVVEDQVSDEFESAKPALRMTSKDITIPYIESWDPCNILDSAPTPTFTRILSIAMDEDRKYDLEKSEGDEASNHNAAGDRIKIVRSFTFIVSAKFSVFHSLAISSPRRFITCVLDLRLVINMQLAFLHGQLVHQINS